MQQVLDEHQRTCGALNTLSTILDDHEGAEVEDLIGADNAAPLDLQSPSLKRKRPVAGQESDEEAGGGGGGGRR